jgi:hypothetical protein
MDITAATEHDAKVGDVLDLLTGGEESAAIDHHRCYRPDQAGTRKLMAAVVGVEQHTEWEPDGDAVVASIDTTISGAPLTVSGTYRLEPTPTGCRSVVELHLGCTVPMLGGTLLASVRPLATRQLTLELDRLDRALRAGC